MIHYKSVLKYYSCKKAISITDITNYISVGTMHINAQRTWIYKHLLYSCIAKTVL